MIVVRMAFVLGSVGRIWYSSTRAGEAPETPSEVREQ